MTVTRFMTKCSLSFSADRGFNGSVNPSDGGRLPPFQQLLQGLQQGPGPLGGDVPRSPAGRMVTVPGGGRQVPFGAGWDPPSPVESLRERVDQGVDQASHYALFGGLGLAGSLVGGKALGAFARSRSQRKAMVQAMEQALENVARRQARRAPPPTLAPSPVNLPSPVDVQTPTPLGVPEAPPRLAGSSILDALRNLRAR